MAYSATDALISVADKSLTITWTAPATSSNVSNAPAGYNIYQGTTAGGESATPVNGSALISGTSVTIPGLTDGTTYYFKVQAVNAVGGSPLSAEVSNAPAGVPATVSTTTITPSSNSVALSWTAPASNGSDILGYNVYRTATAPVAGVSALVTTLNTSGAYFGGAYINGTCGSGATLPLNGTQCDANNNLTTSNLITGTTYTDATATNGTSYYYVVTAVNAIGESTAVLASSLATTPGAVTTAPTGVSVAQGASSTLTLSWSSNTAATTGFNIYQGTTAGGESTTPINALPIANVSTGNSYTATGLTVGTTYYFVIKALNSVGLSGSSSEVFGTAGAGAPGKPTGVTATALNSGALISWTAPASNGSKITSYTVTAVTVNPTNGSPANTQTCSATTTTYCSLSSLINGLTYYVTVKATNAVGTGLSSTATTVVPAVTTPDKPTSVSVAISSGIATLTWTNGNAEGGTMTGVTVYAGTASGAETAVNTYPAGTTTASVVVGASGSYYFYVVNTSTLGVGAKSAEVSAISGGTVAGAPTSLTASEYRSASSTGGAQGKVLLTWAAPASTGGSTITNYYIFPVVNGSTGGAGIIAGTATTSAQLPTSGTLTVAVGACPSGMSTYTWLVTGTGIAAGTTATCATSGGVSTVTLSKAATAATASGASLTFYAPLAAGSNNYYSKITGTSSPYTAATGTLYLDTNASTTGISIDPTTGAGSALIDAVTGGSLFSFEVVSVNSSGANFASTSNQVTLFGPDLSGVPTNVVATPGNGTVGVTWNAPINADGTSAAAYNVAVNQVQSLTPTANVAAITATVAASPSTGQATVQAIGDTTITLGGSSIPAGIGVGTVVTVKSGGTGALPSATTITSISGQVLTLSAAFTTATVANDVLNFGDLMTFTGVTGVALGMEAFSGSDGKTDLGTVVYLTSTSIGLSLNISAVEGHEYVTTFSAGTASAGIPTCPTNVAGSVCVLSTGTSATVFNLPSTATYTFQVSASSDGYSYSALTTATAATAPGAAPGAVSFSVNVNSATSKTAVVSSVSSSGATSYVATATDIATGASFTCANTNVNTCTITGLTNGKLYVISVTAKNAVGSTTSTTNANLTATGGGYYQPQGAAAQVTGVTAKLGSAQGSASVTYPVTVSWSTPSFGGNQFGSYSVTGTDNTTGVVKSYTLVEPIYAAMQGSYTGVVVELSGVTSSTTAVTLPGATVCATFNVGDFVFGTGIPAGTTVVSCTQGSTTGALVISAAATGSATETLNFVNEAGAVKYLQANGSASYCVAPASALLNGTDSSAKDVDLTSATTTCTIYGLAGSGDSWSASVTATSASSPAVAGINGANGAAGVNYGAGLASALSSAIVLTKANTVPSAPVQASLGVSSGTLTVTWTAPSFNGGGLLGNAITGYNVYIGTSAGGESSTPANGSIPVTGTTITLTGLTNGTKYYVIVKAVNLVGSSVASNEKYGTPSTAALAPTSVVATPAATSVALSWSAPSVTGGAAIVGYQVYAWADSLSPSSINPSNATLVTGTSYTVTGLATGTKYDFLVVAMNGVGVSPASTLVSATPAAVASVAVVALPKNVTVSFSASPAAKTAAQMKKMTAAQKAAYNKAVAAATKISAEGLIALNNYALNSVDGSKVTITANGSTAAIAQARANAIANYLVQSGAALHYNIVTAVGTGLNTAVMVTTAA